MRINKDADILTTVKTDPRITKIGNFMRKTSIDEIPQAIDHILLLSDGEVLASGGKESVLTSALLSQAFAIPVSVHQQGNRYWAGIHDFPAG